ncbi:MFS transporter [Granulicella paludicola]|uniref:MFS transporter n=1 Tax=Granulicella paludicola TaxID=474951 RepID=UPI0021E0A659|nr:MFS transporter [Granulicella paludicola]
MRKSLLALTAAAFGIGTTEFIIMGLLPQLAEDFHVSIPKAGTLVSGYALSVTIGSPLVAVALGKMDRRKALLILMSLFTGGNALCALAPGFGLLLGARILTALCHGSFFGIASVLAANLVPKNERAQAIALMFSGLTLANILGVPAGTALGLAFGWRAAFWALVPIGVIAITLLIALVPSQIPEPTHLLQELRDVMKLPVQLVLALSTLSSVAMFCVLTYIAPILEFVTHLSPSVVTWVLVIFGIGITFGNLLGGWLSDRNQMAVILVGMGLLILTFLLMPTAAPFRIPAIASVFLWGFIHFAAAAPFQARIVEKANSPNLASVLNQSAFNFGNAIGASLGGIALTHGLTYRHLPYVSAGIATLALCVAFTARHVDRNEVAEAI